MALTMLCQTKNKDTKVAWFQHTSHILSCDTLVMKKVVMLEWLDQWMPMLHRLSADCKFFFRRTSSISLQCAGKTSGIVVVSGRVVNPNGCMITSRAFEGPGGTTLPDHSAKVKPCALGQDDHLQTSPNVTMRMVEGVAAGHEFAQLS